MSGLLTSSLLLFFTLILFKNPTLEAKSLSGARFRRDLRDAVPYEAQMMSYPAADYKGRSNDLYYQPEALRTQGLGQALQRLVESDQRREQEAAYLASLMRLLSDAQNNGQGKPEEEDEGDFQGPYPPDYDETEQAVSMAKPQASWQGVLDPQLTQALLNRYKQEKLMQAGRAIRVPERETETDRNQEILRYLIEKILSSLASGGNQAGPSNQRAKRDLGAVASMERAGGSALKRARRSLDSAPAPPPQAEASLLRVKRLDDDDDVDDEGVIGQSNRTPHVGLQRMKRIDTDLPPPKTHSRKRRALTFDPNLIAQHILQYLPA